MPSFLKALYITSDDTIFDDDAAMTGIDCVSLGLKSLTHSADTHLSQNDVLRVRMAEMNRSKSALSSNQSGLDAPLKQFQRSANHGDSQSKSPGLSNKNQSTLAKGGAQAMKDFSMSQTQKLSMKTSRDRPSGNMNFNL